MRDHNINQGSSSSLVPIEMKMSTEALKSPLQGKLHAIVILVKDLDLIAGFTDRHTAILSPEMFNHAIFPDPKIPLRTRILVDRWNGLCSFWGSPDDSDQRRVSSSSWSPAVFTPEETFWSLADSVQTSSSGS